MAMHGSNEPGGIFAAINITPLTDIFLVLLIIFMVATAVTIESAAHVDLPKVQAQTAMQPPKGVTVTYTASHEIYVNQKQVSEDQLGGVLKDALSHTPEKLVMFNGDARVILGDMVRILDIAKGAGATQVALAVSGSTGNEAGGATAQGQSAQPVTPDAPQAESVAPAEGGMQ
ncbi:MAG: biopolymer transporter ExbD [Candidatus Binataceae bacterium]|nr:biopolymer transporter ExbD [Candidatus Binataceae bacterium]